MKDKLIVLVPRQGVYLAVARCADPERFARVFRETWARIPDYCRREILAAWRERRRHKRSIWRGDGPCPILVPRITVLPFLPIRAEEEEAVGSWKPEEISYLASAVDAMPEGILATLIAHELAHEFTEIDMSQAFGPCGTRADWEEDLAEIATREENERWGFDEAALTAWLKENQHVWDVPEE